MEATLEKPAERSTEAKSAITLNHLQHALRIVGSAIQARSTLPILQCVRMEQLAEGLAIEATSLDLFIRAMVPESNGPSKPLVVPADKFAGWVKLLSGEDVKISTASSRATVSCSKSRVTLPILPAANWPDNSIYALKGDGITLKQSDLARALRFAFMAVSTDVSRFTLNGVLLEGDGATLKVVATDGHRLMKYSRPCDEKINLLLPSILIKALLPLLSSADDSADVNFSDKQVLVSVASETPVFVGAPRLMGSFPNYEAVIPKKGRTEVTVKVKEMQSSLERCALLSDKSGSTVVLEFDAGQLKLTAASAQSGEAEEIMSCEGAPKEPLRIGINAGYLIDLVKKLDGDLRIALPANGSEALLFKAEPADNESIEYIIMPLRV